MAAMSIRPAPLPPAQRPAEPHVRAQRCTSIVGEKFRRQQIGRWVTRRQAGSFGRGGANTSITPPCSRTINVGNGFGVIGN